MILSVGDVHSYVKRKRKKRPPAKFYAPNSELRQPPGLMKNYPGANKGIDERA